MGFMDPPLRGPCNFASFTTFFLLLSVGYPNSKNRYCQIIWSTQSRHRNQHWVTYRLQELRLMRKSIFTSLWTLAFIQAKDHQSQIDQISEDFQTEFSYRGRMIIPARRPLSGSVTPSRYQTGGPTNLPPSLCKRSNSDKAVHRCKLQNVCDGGDQFTLVPPLRTKSFKYYRMTTLKISSFFLFVIILNLSNQYISSILYMTLCVGIALVHRLFLSGPPRPPPRTGSVNWFHQSAISSAWELILRESGYWRHS